MHGGRVPRAFDLVANRQPLGQLGDMAHHAHDATGCAELFDRRGDHVERVGVERPEAFVEEDGVKASGAASGERRDAVGQRQR